MTETEDIIKALAALELADFLSESIQCLTDEQEEVLIKHINRMTERGMPPTSQIVKNLAEEIIGKPVGKN
ncbi:hypothetical protein ACEPPN_016894 [Leptodophora sp. 'Broadleaf-Isolate-01']